MRTQPVPACASSPEILWVAATTLSSQLLDFEGRAQGRRSADQPTRLASTNHDVRGTICTSAPV